MALWQRGEAWPPTAAPGSTAPRRSSADGPRHRLPCRRHRPPAADRRPAGAAVRGRWDRRSAGGHRPQALREGHQLVVRRGAGEDRRDVLGPGPPVHQAVLHLVAAADLLPGPAGRLQRALAPAAVGLRGDPRGGGPLRLLVACTGRRVRRSRRASRTAVDARSARRWRATRPTPAGSSAGVRATCWPRHVDRGLVIRRRGARGPPRPRRPGSPPARSLRRSPPPRRRPPPGAGAPAAGAASEGLVVLTPHGR